MRKSSYCLGIDLGGTAIKYGICSAEGKILTEAVRPTAATSPVEHIIRDLVAAAKEALDFANQNKLPIHSIGVGTPGSVNVPTGFLNGGTPNFEHWKNVPIKELMEAQLPVPVFVDNDANVMIYGEFMFGAGRGYKDVVGVTLGTGIGGGVIINGEIFRGSYYAGAELGHMSINYDGERCRCGGIGCWEVYASATAMIRNYNSLSPENPVKNSRQIFEKYAEDEATAQQVVELEAKLAGVGIANLLNIFNPEVLIVGGGISEAGEWFIEKISHHALNRAMPAASVNTKIVSAQLGNSAGWLGAGIFAFHQLNRAYKNFP